MGVLIATGLQGMGQRSRHSGWVTTRQSWQRRHIFPNFVLLPQATQNSDLITLTEETPRSVHDPSSWILEFITDHPSSFRKNLTGVQPKDKWRLSFTCTATEHIQRLHRDCSLTVLGIKWCFFPPPGVRSVSGCETGVLGASLAVSDSVVVVSAHVWAAATRKCKYVVVRLLK